MNPLQYSYEYGSGQGLASGRAWDYRTMHGCKCSSSWSVGTYINTYINTHTYESQLNKTDKYVQIYYIHTHSKFYCSVRISGWSDSTGGILRTGLLST